MSKPYIWKAEFTLTVVPCWVADGFDLTEERLNDILQEAFSSHLGWSYEGEVVTKGTVTAAPDPARIREEQGG